MESMIGVNPPPGGYSVIYADPPWQFNNKKTGGGAVSGAEQHYPTMSIDDLKKLPVESIAADNCVLIMWWVGSMNQEALDLVESWGFKVVTSTGFVWVKMTKQWKLFFGMGSWTRAGAECAIIATRGKPKPFLKSVRSVRTAYAGKHSRKPEEFRQDIVDLCGDVPRIELFAREKFKGWDHWGNEV